MRLILACLTLIILVFFYGVVNVAAQGETDFGEVTGGQVNEAMQKIAPIRFLPSHPLYFSIYIKEVISRFFKPSAVKRAEFDFVLSGKRLKESYLLLELGDTKNSSSALSRYSARIGKMTWQLDKARSQNQDVSAIVEEVAEGLRAHEILFAAIAQKASAADLDYDFSENFDSAGDGFIGAIGNINNIKPGVKNRFKSASQSADISENKSLEATGSPYIEATGSRKPARIIY